MRSKKLLSIVVPTYNEETVIDTFFDVLIFELNKIDIEFEIICVDDGSKDSTVEKIIEKASKHNKIKLVELSRNFGKEAAMTAGLEFATGDAVIPIDADLQDPPELIVKMIEHWQKGVDVIYAKRVSRNSDTVLKRHSAGLFYRIFNIFSEIKIPENVGDFRLMDRRVVDVINKLPEKDRFMKGLFCWPGFSNVTLEFEREERHRGDTKFNYWSLWNFALNGITSFSSVPIRLGVYLGLVISIVAFFYGAWIVLKTLTTGIDVPGYASLMVAVLFLGGIQLFFLGLLGEYIGRIYKEVKNRPIYIVKSCIGFKSDRD